MRRAIFLIAACLLLTAGAQSAPGNGTETPSPGTAAQGTPAGQAASRPTLQTFLAPLVNLPSLKAAGEQVASARAQLRAAYDPVSLQASGGYSRFDNNLVDSNPAVPGVQPLPNNGGQISAGLTLRPWLFGDTADQADKSRIQLQQAELEYRSALTGMQVQALQAAYGVQLAQESLASAQDGERVSQAALDATRLRYAKGAASDRDLRNAETNLQQAQGYVADARGSLGVARATLESLVGPTAAPVVAKLSVAVPKGTAESVQKARLSADLAAVSVRNATRSVYPVVQASYTWNVDNEDSVGVSIESRTLQPKVSYDFQSPGTAFPEDQVNSSFQIGVSMTLSPGVIDGLQATRAQLRAARDGVASAERTAAVQKATLDNDLAQARRGLDLARRKADDARKTLAEDQTRQQLGLADPLTTQQAALDLTKSLLDLQKARQDVLAKTLAYYSFYAEPLVTRPVSEVKP